MSPAKKWDFLKIVCGACGAPMEIKNGPWGTFYACTRHPQCANRFTTNIYELLLDRVYDRLMREGTAENLRFDIRRSRLNIRAEVRKTTDHQVTMAVVNLVHLPAKRAAERAPALL